MMAKETKIVGDGITARKYTTYSGNDAGPFLKQKLRDLAEAYRERGSYFEINIESIDAFCDAALKEAGISPGEERGTSDSVENFASRIKQSIRFTRKFIAANDAANTARFALELGHLIAQFDLKHGWEAHALRGEKIIKHARDGHEAVYGTTEKKEKRWAKQRAAYREARSEGLTKKAAKLEAAERCGVSVRSIERAFQKAGEPIP